MTDSLISLVKNALDSQCFFNAWIFFTLAKLNITAAADRRTDNFL